MARIIHAPRAFRPLKLIVTLTVYDFENTVHEVYLPVPLSPDSIDVRTILVKGRIKIEFPDTNEPSFIAAAPGRIHPLYPEVLGKNKVKSTMLEDGVEVQCICPFPGYKIQCNEIDLETIETSTHTIEKGQLAFIFGDSYTLNGKYYSSFEMFAVQSKDVILKASKLCHLVTFRAIPEGV